MAVERVLVPRCVVQGDELQVFPHCRLSPRFGDFLSGISGASRRMPEGVRTKSFKMAERSAISFSTPTNAPRARTVTPSRSAATTSPSRSCTCSACRSQSFWIARITSSVVGARCRCFIGFSLWFLLFVLALGLHPGFELPDGIALHRQFDMGVEGIDFFARGVAHKGLPHVLHDSRFHEPGVEGVAKILKAEVADARSPDCRLPGRFDPADRTVFEGEDQPFRLVAGGKEFRESRRE